MPDTFDDDKLLDWTRLGEFGEVARRFAVLEALLYEACLRVSQRSPHLGAIKKSRLFPNTRGVREEYDQLFSRIATIRSRELRTIGVDRRLASDFFTAVSRYDIPIRDPFPPEQDCAFYLGCPTRVFSPSDRSAMRDNGILSWEQDHVRPAAAGGARLQTLCAVHNHLKGDTLLWQPDAFMIPMFDFEENL